MTENKIRYMSYSRGSKDEECERARYYGSEWGGTGLSSVDSGFDLVFGNIQHKYLDGLAQTGSIDFQKARTEVLEAATKAGKDLSLARSYGAMAEGQLRGFVRYIWPTWMSEYEIVEAEKMRQWEVRPGFIFRFRQDILLRNKFDGSLVYPDYKTTSSNKPEWIASWAKHPQIHSSMYAMKQAYGIEIQHALIPGLYKGYKDKKDNQLKSIFASAWVNREYSMMPEYSYEYKRTRGWERFSTFEEFDDLEKWVGGMPENILQEQFPITGPIALREDIAEAYFRQLMYREQEVADATFRLETSTDIEEVTAILDKHFRQDFSKCHPAWGYSCEFEPLCWIPWIGADPVGSGQFVRREPTVE